MINLTNFNLFSEVFLGISIILSFLFATFIAYSNMYNYPLIQFPFIYIAILIMIMAIYLLFNDSLIVLSILTFNETTFNDYLSYISKLFIGFGVIFYLIIVQTDLISQKINHFEYILIILLAVVGLFLLCSSNDLLSAYLAIELHSLAFYILASFKKNSSYSVESGLKYFILGSFSSALFLFGSSLIYGLAGTINFEDFRDLFAWSEIGDRERYISTLIVGYNCSGYPFQDNFDDGFLELGLFLILISLFFKLALAPFHLWSPDVYEGSPSSSTFFFVVISKLSLFVLLIRICYSSFYCFVDSWQFYCLITAVLSIFVGAVAGLKQRKLKSLLAYSSISHMGYALLSFSSGSLEGVQMLFFYLIIYMISGLSIWSIILALRLKISSYKNKFNKDLGDLTLLKNSNSILAFILGILLFSLAGIPPMIGFLAKMSIFLAAIGSSMYVIVLVSILLSVISTFYYIRIIKILYFENVLVGRLYYPIYTKKTIIISFLAFFLIFLFINPTFLYLMSYKLILFLNKVIFI